MGKHVIDAADAPGFLVNRCDRPFGLEALRLVQERLATVEQVDRICRLGGGFRMGPFELMDLVGIDVGFEVVEVVLRAVVRRAALAAVDAGGAQGRLRRARAQDRARLVRLPRGRRAPPARPRPAERRRGGDGLVVIGGWTALADELREAAEAAGWRVADPEEAAGDEVPALVVDCGGLDTAEDDWEDEADRPSSRAARR